MVPTEDAEEAVALVAMTEAVAPMATRETAAPVAEARMEAVAQLVGWTVGVPAVVAWEASAAATTADSSEGLAQCWEARIASQGPPTRPLPISGLPK